MLQYALILNAKSKLFNKNELVTIEDVMIILKESINESKKQAKEIIASINSNACVKEITKEAINRCEVI